MHIEIKLSGVSVEDITRLREGLPEKVRITGLHEETQTLEATLDLTVNEVFQLLAIQNIIATPVFELTEPEQKLYIEIEELSISVRVYNTLKLNGYEYIGDIVQKRPSDFLQYHGFGKTSLKELSAELERVELTFGMNLGNFPDALVLERIRLARQKKIQDIQEELGRKFQMDISHLGLKPKTEKCLSQAGIHTVGQLVQQKMDFLLQLNHFGPGALKELRNGLYYLGLSLGMTIPESLEGAES